MIRIKLKKIYVLIMLLGFSFLSGCGQETVIFSGESENWRMQIEYVQSDGYSHRTGFIQYIGTDPVPKELEYSITINDSSGSGPLASDGYFALPNSVSECEGCIPSEESEIVGVIEWDEQTETITLTIE